MTKNYQLYINQTQELFLKSTMQLLMNCDKIVLISLNDCHLWLKSCIMCVSTKHIPGSHSKIDMHATVTTGCREFGNHAFWHRCSKEQLQKEKKRKLHTLKKEN